MSWDGKCVVWCCGLKLMDLSERIVMPLTQHSSTDTGHVYNYYWAHCKVVCVCVFVIVCVCVCVFVFECVYVKVDC